MQEFTATNGAGAASCAGRAATGRTMPPSRIGLAAMPPGQSWQWPSCSRLAWSPGAGFAPGTAKLFVPELVQTSAVSSLLFSWEAASAVSVILNRTANSTAQASDNWNLPWRNMRAFYCCPYVSCCQQSQVRLYAAPLHHFEERSLVCVRFISAMRTTTYATSANTKNTSSIHAIP